MPNLSVEIPAVELRDQQLAYYVNFAGTSDETYQPGAFVSLRVFDASGTERWSRDEEVPADFLTNPPHWVVDLPTDLDDGDYAAWVYATAWDDPVPGGSASTSDHHTEASQGLNFMVGRGRIYPSAEAVAPRNEGGELELGDPRLSGTWVVTDVRNTADYDVSTTHSLNVFLGTDLFGEVKGEELVHGNATQQVNHLLPEGMPDGRYTLVVVVRPEAADLEYARSVDLEKHGEILTVIPV